MVQREPEATVRQLVVLWVPECAAVAPQFAPVELMTMTLLKKTTKVDTQLRKFRKARCHANVSARCQQAIAQLKQFGQRPKRMFGQVLTCTRTFRDGGSGRLGVG